MVYEIEGRFYIVASGYYREVTIKKENDDYTIVPVVGGKKIIRNIEDGYKQIHYTEAYKKSHKEKSRFSEKEK